RDIGGRGRCSWLARAFGKGHSWERGTFLARAVVKGCSRHDMVLPTAWPCAVCERAAVPLIGWQRVAARMARGEGPEPCPKLAVAPRRLTEEVVFPAGVHA